jgi:RNA polymerase-binding transcription factor DksA
MATKKPATKPAKAAAPKKATAVKAAKPAAKPAKKTAPAKPAAKKAAAKPAPATKAKAAAPKKAAPAPAKPVKKAAPAKPAPAKPVTTKAPAKPVKAAAPKKAAPAPVKKAAPAKPAPPPAKPVKKAAPVAEVKPAKPAKLAPAPKPEKKATVKQSATRSVKADVSKPAVRVSGIEKATTVIPMKQLPQKKKDEPVKEVKMPKITVKTSVPYNPGYTPLEQRVETSKPNEPLVRYSDSELNEFRELINKKLEASKKELAYLQGLITRKDELGGDNDDARYMTMEDGSISMEREQLSQMASRQITYIDHLEKAIMRIENKTYGICRVTGKLIDKARLRAVPHATLSLEAKLGLVKPGNNEQ